MRLPGVEHAVIEPRKIRDYLLSTSHAEGRAKAALFGRLGYSRGEWRELAADLRLYPPHGLEVEFLAGTGRTKAVVTLADDDVRPPRDGDLISVRPPDASG